MFSAEMVFFALNVIAILVTLGLAFRNTQPHKD